MYNDAFTQKTFIDYVGDLGMLLLAIAPLFAFISLL